MQENILNGIQLEHIVTEAEELPSYNSVRWWVNDVEVFAKDIKMIIYNDRTQD